MPSTKILSSWLAYVIPISLAIAVLATVGCGKSDNSNPPTLSDEAGIQNIQISHGTLVPAFSEGETNYQTTAFNAEAPNFSLTVTLKDSTTRLYVNDKRQSNGEAIPHPLLEGSDTITISTLSQDGNNTKTYIITPSMMSFNTKIFVLDGVGGVTTEETEITVTDGHDQVVVDGATLPSDTNRPLMVYLDPAQKYNIYARSKKSAETCFANFDRSREDEVILHCLPGGAPPYVIQAPIITDISFATENSVSGGTGGWVTTYNDDAPFTNHLADTRTNLAAVRITVISKNPVTDLYGATDPPIVINLDALASVYVDGSARGTAIGGITSVPYENGMYFQTVYRFAVPYGDTGQNADHWLDIIAYDMANNRVNQRVYLTIKDAPPPRTGDPNLSLQSSSFLYTAQAQTYGVSMNIPGISPVDPADPVELSVTPVPGYGGTCFNSLEFKFIRDLMTFGMTLGQYPSGAPSLWDQYINESFPSIRGFEVYRSDGNDQNFQLIDTVRFATLVTGVNYTGFITGESNSDEYLYAQMFTYRDVSHDLREDVMYYYKIRAFNSHPTGGYTPASNVLQTKPLPAFVTKLTEPADNRPCDKIWPTFKFKISNPALFKTSDRFYFTLYVKTIMNLENAPTYASVFQVNLRDLNDQGDPRIMYEDNGVLYDAVYNSGEKDKNGNDIYLPFVFIDYDGTVTINTDNSEFRQYLARNKSLQPGTVYEWTVFGMYNPYYALVDGGLPPTFGTLFYSSHPLLPGAPGPYTGGYDEYHQNGAVSNSMSFGSISNYNMNAVNGHFILIISPDAN
jgi:hypothetical protein